MTKTYTMPEKSWLLQAGRGTWIGSEFLDHGKLMRVVAIGKAYKDSVRKDNIVDIEAVEVPRNPGGAGQ
jgi:hypothetical protein